ncbi:MAG: ABC transporter ATP-binding protein [Christensenellales bacterium]|jgi:putative ABC transport system ATP-binding protein
MIEARNLFKRYTQDVEALHDVSLSVPAGSFIAIMGPSGSGKSTLLNILGCLDRPDSGQYDLDGRRVSAMSSNELAVARGQLLGFVFQSFNLLPRLSALENVELPLYYGGVPSHRRRVLAKEALERVQLTNRIRHLPGELSGGQKQRVAIARALVNNPSVILADEPTGNLDSKTGNEIMAILSQLHKAGATIVLITHEASVAGYAQQIYTMRDGVLKRAEEVSRH